MRHHRVLHIISLAFLCASVSAGAQEKKHFLFKSKPAVEAADTLAPKYSDAFLDTVNIKKQFITNDYMLLGVEYGVSRNSMMFTPQFKQIPVFFPEYFGVTFTRYGKLVGLPMFGFQAGIFFGHEGFEFEPDKTTGAVVTIENATKVEMDYVEIPLYSEFHADATHFKVLVDVGPYAGYRLNIHRSSPFDIDPELIDNFTSYENRLDYGLGGGAGFGIMFPPFEFNVKLKARWSWSNLWEPDYNSKYYYRYAYPFDFMLTAGISFQLTKSHGKTKAMIRKEAHDAVFLPKTEE